MSSSSSEIKRGTVLSYISMILTNISAILVTPYMLRSLGKSEVRSIRTHWCSCRISGGSRIWAKLFYYSVSGALSSQKGQGRGTELPRFSHDYVCWHLPSCLLGRSNYLLESWQYFWGLVYGGGIVRSSDYVSDSCV